MTTAATQTRAVADVGQPGAATASVGSLTRFALRRDRFRLGVWTLGIAGTTIVTANSFTELYPSAADRAQTAQSMNSPAALAMTGPERYLHGDYGFGAIMSHQMLGFTAIMVGLMSVLMVVRHSRAEEESGRAELIRATVVGRHAHLLAALNATILANLVVAAVMAVGLGALGIEGMSWEGSVVYGAAHLAVGLTFVGIAAIAVQVTENSRGANGLGLGLVAVAYVLRAAGDVGDGTASWLSPIGWAQRTWAYVDDRWWPVLLGVGAGAIGAVIGFVLSTRRDVGAGLRASRPGNAEAPGYLGSSFGLAVRLQRGVFIGFAIATLLLGASYGSVMGDVEEMVNSMGDVAKALERIGGATIVDSFLSMITTIFAVLAAVYAVMAALRIRGEETAGRAEGLLSTPLSRPRWAVSHLVIAFIGGPIMLALCALGLGLLGAPALDDSGLLPRALGAAIVYTPAVWLCVGAAIALIGLVPRAAQVVWIIPLYAFLAGYLGELLQLPTWMQNISPMEHVPGMPVDDFTVVPLVILTAIAAALTALGLWGLRRRDLATN